MIKLNPFVIIGLITVIALLIGISQSNAQTQVPVPNVSDTTQATEQNNASSHTPLSDRQLTQTIQHLNGTFTTMRRDTYKGGQIQEAWDTINEADAGYFEYPNCETCVYRILLREHMVSIIEFPRNEVIKTPDIGDSYGFTVESRGQNTLAIRPNGYGIDTSMIVYGQDGRKYAFYLRAENAHSSNLPDLYVKINRRLPEKALETPAFKEASTPNVSNMSGVSVSGEKALAEEIVEELATPKELLTNQDFVEAVPFNAGELHGWGNYGLSGEGWRENQKPLSIFRDKQFTYIYFGENWENIELPTAYVVVDDIDELVNTRVTGKTYVIESVNPVVTLKSGESYLCITYLPEAQNNEEIKET